MQVTADDDLVSAESQKGRQVGYAGTPEQDDAIEALLRRWEAGSAP